MLIRWIANRYYIVIIYKIKIHFNSKKEIRNKKTRYDETWFTALIKPVRFIWFKKW